MSTVRERAIEAGARALREYWMNAGLETNEEFAAAVVDAVEPILRADAYAEFMGATEMERRAWRDDFIAARTEADLRERIAQEIEDDADALWAEIERHTLRYGGATEPGSVDPYLEERHAGLLSAANIARGTP